MVSCGGMVPRLRAIGKAIAVDCFFARCGPPWPSLSCLVGRVHLFHAEKKKKVECHDKCCKYDFCLSFFLCVRLHVQALVCPYILEA